MLMQVDQRYRQPGKAKRRRGKQTRDYGESCRTELAQVCYASLSGFCLNYDASKELHRC